MVRWDAHAFIAFGFGLASVPGGSRGDGGGDDRASTPATDATLVPENKQ